MKITYNTKYNFKKLLSILFVISALIFIPSISLAEEEVVFRVKGEDVILKNNDSVVTPLDHGGTYYTKTVQKKWKKWSNYERVSQNIVIKKGQSGSISSTSDTSFGVVITGNVANLGFSTNASLSSTIGYSLSVNTPGTYYMAYRAMYNYESGIRYKRSGWSGLVMEKNNYTIGIPEYGEYTLIKVR